MRRLLILIAALSFVACGDDADSEQCSGVGDCAPGERCDEGVCVADTRQCVALQAPANGDVSHPDSPGAGDAANYSCDEGYALEGDAARTCEASGEWSGTAPRCVDEEDPEPPVLCALLDPIADGEVDQPAEAEPGDEATYSCDEGYVLLGAEVRVCGEDGEWGGEAPTCAEPLPCDEALSDPENGSVSVPADPIVGDFASYSCDEGYLLVGKAERICGEGGVWAGDAPSCELNMCLAATELAFNETVVGDDDEEVEVPVGFDLDGQNTTESAAEKLPENGCGVADAPGGIDNQLGAVLGLLALFNLDVEGSINELVGDSLNFATSVRHTDDGMRLDFGVNGEPVVEDLELTEVGEGIYEGSSDLVVLDLRDLHLTDIEPEEGDPGDDEEPGPTIPVYVDLRLTLNEARIQVDTNTGAILLGGTVVYGDEESGEETLRPSIAAIIDGLIEAGADLPVGMTVIDSLFMGAADMALDGENCVDLSLGLKLENTIGLCE